MATRMPARPTPEQFHSAYTEQLIEPALTAVSGRDGRTSRTEAGRIEGLEGPRALAAGAVGAFFEETGFRTSSTPRVARDAARPALEAMLAARGPDGRIDPARLPPALQAAYAALGGEAAGGLPPGQGPVEPAPGARPLRYSARVLAKVLDAYGLQDGPALIAEAAARHNADGNGYLKRSELEAAAKVLAREVPPDLVADLGIISDLDKTIVPEHDDVLPGAAYPGIAQLLVELEAADGNGGDLTFVTARTPERVTEMPEWLTEHGVPEGPIETGVSGVPWIAQAEKIRDISRVFDANPGKSFVMFGDTSHRDPEAYRGIQERYGDRVTAAFIHRVTADVPPERVEGLYLIDDYAEAAAHLHDLGVLDTDAARRVMVSAQMMGLDISDAHIDGLLGVR